MASLACFHFMEFFATALYSPSTATYDCASAPPFLPLLLPSL